MLIAVIGWGSLIWDPRELDRQGRWHTCGPRLPIEFARISKDDRLTLVIVKGADLQQTYWVRSGLDTLNSARNDLRQREGTSKPFAIHWTTRTVAHDPDDTIAGLLALYRKMSASDRIRIGHQMSLDARAITLAAIRRRHPEYDDISARWALFRILVGDDLFRKAWPNAPMMAP